jgi:hypothetical protein
MKFERIRSICTPLALRISFSLPDKSVHRLLQVSQLLGLTFGRRISQVGDIVRVEVLEPANVRKEGVEGQWGYGVPYGVLKSVKPGWSLAYALVRKVSTGRGRKAVLQWLQRCKPAALDGEEGEWTPWPVTGSDAVMDVDNDAESDAESDGESDGDSDGEARGFELKTVTWNSIIDLVESVKVEDHRGTVYRFKTLPPVRVRI